MKLVNLLPVLAIVFVAGCIGQADGVPGDGAPGTPDAGPPAGPTEGPGITEPAEEPLPPPSSRGIGFVLVTPQPGQHVFTNNVAVVIAPVNFTIVEAGTAVNDMEGYLKMTLDDGATVDVFTNAYTFPGVAEGAHELRVEVVSADGMSLNPALTRILHFTTGEVPESPTGCEFDNPSCPAEFVCKDNICVSRGMVAG